MIGFFKSKIVGLCLVLLLCTSAGLGHKFYISVTNVMYSEKDDALQITTRIFIDDFERLLQNRYGLQLTINEEEEMKIAKPFIEKYLRAKMVFRIDDNPMDFDFLGTQVEEDLVICYLEIPKIKLKKRKTFEVQNEVLMDLYDEQKNMLHVKWQGNRKSFVMIKENNKGMLNW